MSNPRKGRIAALAMALVLGAQAGLPVAWADRARGERAGSAGRPGDARSNGPLRPGPNDGTGRKTETPIEHVIVIVGENRTFDNVYGTYVPKRGQTVSNLLSKGIVRADGSPGPNKNLALQFQVATIDPPSYFISTDRLSNPRKTSYAVLPTPESGTAPPLPVTLAQLRRKPLPSIPPFDSRTFSREQLRALSPMLSDRDLHLLTTGATGLPNCTKDPADPPSPCRVPDKRVANFAALPNTVFPITGPTLPYDSYAGDMVHRFFHMWQQSDCDARHAALSNPSGCANDLYPFVGIASGDDSGSNSMGFFNMTAGDAPLFKRLADDYTMSDNYHQPTMGGTGVQHTMLGAADSIFWEAVDAFPAEPPAAQVANPDPRGAANDKFVRDGRWTRCGDAAAPGVGPILSYLKSLPWRPDQTASNCLPGRFYMINNTRPGYLSNGTLNAKAIQAGTAVPPSSLRTIGDALNEKNISWAYYGGGFRAAVRLDDGSRDPFNVLIGTEGAWYCDICNPFQYAASIMGDPAQRAEHVKDAVDLLGDLDRGRLPAVSYLKPDSFDDGHPASSKLNLFEAFVERVLDGLKAHPDLFASTAVFITFDEGGGYWDSGFFQPIDFFGDGPRIPFVVVSPYARGGKVVHTYTDHASVVKFIERNWRLPRLTGRSRDNLPNPIHTRDTYVPDNMPAIGDLFDMFDFHQTTATPGTRDSRSPTH